MRLYLLATLAGLALAPVGVAVLTALTYLALGFRGRGRAEDQGRRGLLAGCLGTIFGSALGFYAGFQLAWFLISDAAPPGSTPILAALTGLLGAMLLGLPAWVAGIHLAERRGVTNYAGERAAWGFAYVALPLATLGALTGFLGGWWLAAGG